MPLIYLSCAWVVGIFLGSKVDLPLALVLVGLIPLPLLLLLRQHRKTVIIISICLVAFFGGGFCYQSSLPPDGESGLQFYNDRGMVELKGVVARDPEVRARTIQLYLSAIEIKSGEEWREVSGTVLLFVPRYSAYRYGDALRVTGELETPPRLGDFDYEDCVVTIASSATGSTPVISMF